ncbi:MetQ/NlpA family ABC transporter substrate-binding protein [Acholeplasma granularum]|uniref:MetQ/NlpA family ABC transporter substrate-binding protein n=1 Tax=Acholeplasma granularum TaxID=264635 RepID=UPI00046E65CB|nr:MetQ/NlpA family ABC transporter substrate-binding protein [Acholeplasma granularum]
MKKTLLLLTTTFLIILLVGCKSEASTLKIGVNFYPMPEIVDLISEDLKNEGIEVEQVQMDYNVLNTPLKNKEIDGNLIQHQYFMEFFNKSNNSELVVAQRLYHSKFALYSSVFNSIDEITNGTTIYIPEDEVNLPRALILLDSLGLITLKERITVTATLEDIIENPKNLVFKPKSLGTTSNAYHSDGAKLAIMYPTYARDTNNQLMDDSEVLAYEELNELTMTYAISFVVRKDDLEDPRIQIFISYLTSSKVRTWLEENYGWAATPAF